jgi:hypothetical protein
MAAATPTTVRPPSIEILDTRATDQSIFKSRGMAVVRAEGATEYLRSPEFRRVVDRVVKRE